MYDSYIPSDEEPNWPTPVEMILLLQFIFANYHKRNLITYHWEGLTWDSIPC